MMNMRVGIIGSGYEVALITSWLPVGIDVDCFLDRAMWPRTSKSLDDIHVSLQKGIDYLLELGVDYIIVPPYAEHNFNGGETKILPFFSEYMMKYVLSQSRVGKLGILSMHGSSGTQDLKNLIHTFKASYHLTAYQQTTKSFVPTFPYRSKDCSHRQLHLPYAQRRSWIMRNLIKDDLRYFKDCGVDTLVPIDRGIVYREKMIRHRLGARMKFHGQQAVCSVLVSLLGAKVGEDSLPGMCRLWVTAYPQDLLENKKRKQLFDWGGKREIHVSKI